ncbi:branched-chain amino acid ABC transporter permease [Bacillus sp. AFS076308]|uniref:branched-chain amino acid ABC transporter permease n=1 Tax=unclassified Bacillus (in: firmicutes) TaxID=185979 RepID=UPI000BF9CFBB|nr:MULTISPECIES: branched-chain amino acid ABC transporter permease [unclassified Bacillus (in: firmicutes)]PFN76470.1 branched-chain amino acid ABC transporter permease [Bacillus sp. AFS076308]PGV47056.1 branched-chain amino acid ABC transporter permease [Bacillus sp. AFS037270]
MRLIQGNKMTAFILVIAAFLILLPFVYESRNLFILLTQIFVFAIFAMSYDLLIGFTGIVSFGHAMFFGIGAYSMGIFMKKFEPTMTYFFLAVLSAIILTGLVSFIVGLLTLRLKSHFYAMLTLSLSGLFLVLAEKWRSMTYGNDGFTFRVPELLIDRTHFYWLSLCLMVAIFLFLKRFTNSPLGRVLQAIRENEQRTESLGFQVLHYKIAASVVSGVIAGIAGILYAISLRFVNTSVFSMDITLDALLMTIIGGVGTLVGAIIGAGLIEFAHDWLTALAKEHVIFERWIIFFGIIYILVVMFFPKGIVGTLSTYSWKRKKQTAVKSKEKVAG